MRIVNLSPDESNAFLACLEIGTSTHAERAEQSAEVNRICRIVWEYHLYRLANDMHGSGYDHAALCMIARSICVNVDGVEPFAYQWSDALTCEGLREYLNAEDVRPRWWAATCFYNESTGPVTRRLVRQTLHDTSLDVPTCEDDNAHMYVNRWQTALEWLHSHGHLSTDLP